MPNTKDATTMFEETTRIAKDVAKFLQTNAIDVMERNPFRDYSQVSAYRWTARTVAGWVCFLGLEDYAEILLKNGVDGITLLNLRTKQFSRCLGMHSPNHAYSFKKGLHLLRNGEKIDFSNWEWSADNVEKWLEKRGLGTVSKIFRDNAVHGGVLLSFTERSLHHFLQRLPNQDLNSFSELAFKSLWLTILRAKQIETSILQPESFIQDWGINEIKTWLDHIDLGHLLPKFKAHCVNGTSLVKLTRHDLSGVMGTSELQTIVLMRHIKKLRKFVDDNRSTASDLLQEESRVESTKAIPLPRTEAFSTDTTEESSPLKLKNRGSKFFGNVVAN